MSAATFAPIRLAPVLIGVAVCLTSAAQQGDQTEYRNTVQPFLAKNCLACHNAKLRTANLSLDGASVAPATWTKVLDKLSAGQMPPPGSPRPGKAEVAAVTRWIEGFAGSSASGPGRVTTRRLNRAEYNNTIRDLLGVSLRPADEFPLDDAGYGFDNNGDVLSVSPLLMEKYVAAARKVSRAAVFGESAPARPTRLIRFMSKKSQDDPTPNALPYSYRGAIYGNFDFPVTAEYEFRMRVGNYRPRDTGSARQTELSHKRSLTDEEKAELREENRKAYPPVKMVMTVDGSQLLTQVVEGNIDFDYAHGETIGRVRLAAGQHRFRASFPEFADLDNVHDNVNLDGRRMLFIDYVDIVGPFQPASEPPASRKRLFVCEEQTPDCTRRILQNLAARAYRRPATAQEIEQLTGLAAMVRNNGDSFEESIRVALQAVLMSPNFLFRVEQDSTSEYARPLNGYELASRLSYFLWTSMPDEELMRAAGDGRLTEPEVLSEQARRMLRDPKSSALVENFFGQWLGLRLMDRRKPSPGQFPNVDDELLEAMRHETELFARAVIDEDRSVLDFIDGRFSFLNGPLAHHYGIPGVRGEDFTRVEFDGEQRGGVLTQGSVLTLSSYATRTSPVLRGKWVLENLLGTPPPPPPPDIPALQEEKLGVAASLRQRLEQHRANPSCAVCHDQMDAIGFGLENYDASGAWRTRDGNFAVDSSGKLPGGAAFNGPKQLKQVLKAQSDLFVHNLTVKLLTYAVGRGVESQDRQTVAQITSQLAAGGYRFSTLVNEIIMSEPFRMREGLHRPTGGNIAAHR